MPWLASMLAGEAPGCDVQAKIDLAYVAVHRYTELNTSGWYGFDDPSMVDVRVAGLVLAGEAVGLTAFDRFPNSYYALSTDDVENGRLPWLVGDEPLVSHACGGGVVIYKK